MHFYIVSRRTRRTSNILTHCGFVYAGCCYIWMLWSIQSNHFPLYCVHIYIDAPISCPLPLYTWMKYSARVCFYMNWYVVVEIYKSIKYPCSQFVLYILCSLVFCFLWISSFAHVFVYIWLEPIGKRCLAFFSIHFGGSVLPVQSNVYHNKSVWVRVFFFWSLVVT